MKWMQGILSAALILTLGTTAAWPQAEPAMRPGIGPTSVQTFHLSNASQIQDGNEIITLLRNVLDPRSKITFVSSQNIIAIEATSDQLAIAKKLLDELDQPKKAYRLTYTIIDTDGTKRIGEQHYAMIAVPGQRSLMKQGSKVPVVIADSKTPSGSQITYIDVGMNFDATLVEVENGIYLRTKVERSSIAEDKSIVSPQDPIVRQSVMEGSSILTLGKPLVIGSLDILDSTRHLDVQVTLDRAAPDTEKKSVKP